MTCEYCDDEEGGCVFPYYGLAPHDTSYRNGKFAMGPDVELPWWKWPKNFSLDPEAGEWTGLPRAGVYTHCLHCGAPNGDETRSKQRSDSADAVKPVAAE